MQLHELELTVGDVVVIGEFTVTVMDIENDEVTFRIDEPKSDSTPDVDSTSPRPR